MQKLTLFSTIFIIALIATGIFLFFYLKAFFAISFNDGNYGIREVNPLLDVIFSPAIIISGIAMLVTNFAYRALAIFYVSKIASLSSGEKIMWILGFVFFGFVTAIVFILIARNRKLLE